jgi:serine/threonine protein kinase
VNSGQTRFFCRCGRLLTVDAGSRDVTCPTCKERNVVPHLGAAAPPARDLAREPAAAPPPAGSATAVLGPRATHRVGPFELVALLGQGGMGSVWRARDPRHGRDVALKLLHPALQSRPDFLSRFQREARAAASLRHANIVEVLDSGIDGPAPWIAMELVEGDDFLAAAQRGLLRIDNIVPIALQAARGLMAAAAMGITHRDVKPGNLLLTRDGVVKVADFGLAKAVDSTSRVTVTGEILGTPHYMAPEQGKGDRVDHRADLYALGATLYHVLGGAPPHEAESPVAVIMKHLREEPLPLRTRNPGVPVGLERVIHRLLQKEPEQRYQSHAALIDDLERLAEGREPHEQTTEFVLEPAGALRRLLAFAVDLAAVEVLLHLLLIAGRTILGGATSQGSFFRRLTQPELDSGDPARTALLAGVAIAAALLYFLAADARGGRTVGRKWLSLRLCGRDGGDLGLARAAWRTLLIAPGLLLIAPTLTRCVEALFRLLQWDDSLAARAPMGAGLAWLLVLELLGRMSAFGRPLQDGLSGAFVYVAQRSRTPASWSNAKSTTTSPGRAARWSIVPGGGLVSVGHPFAGLAFFAATMGALFTGAPAVLGIGLWVGAGALARSIARRRQGEAAARPTPTAAIAPPPPTLRRQES